jgi:tripartite-type tricarboxylate transporter receptor subunit TctC
MLGRKAGFKTLIIPYKGASPAITELLGGQTDFMLSTPQGALAMVKAGKLRALAVTSARRLPLLPEVPTIAESGYKDFEAVDWKVVVAPAGTPADVIMRINEATVKALANPAMVAQLAAEGSTPMGGSAEKATQYVKAEQAEWAAVIREAGIKFD